MKRFLLAAVLLAPLAISPSFAQGGSDASGYVDTARIQTRMWRGDDVVHTGSVLRTRRPGLITVSPAERIQIDRQAVPSSAFSGSRS